MNVEEAIKNVTAYVYMECENMPQQVIKALDVLKEYAKECERYRELGTVEELEESLNMLMVRGGRMIDEKKLIEELNKLPIKTTSKWVETSVNSEVFKEIVTGKYIDKNAVLGTINKQPKVGEWIPCSERLPEKFEDVLVITDNDIQRVWNLTESYGQLLWEDEYGYWSPFENVVAWMPLPQPFREGE